MAAVQQEPWLPALITNNNNNNNNFTSTKTQILLVLNEETS
jgi:hypothetical protein